ncbi:hypothetical protein AVEN_166603-1 [Araneus ventricosus]|uniref:Uncharacterized protein n=1 Tax=Araneus ventricosus TaxID=182803 RepID=A0A4Y2WK41_ARAVE|nr:hypothetical protein AVEN_166603-1 [Araneus ventricosus]
MATATVHENLSNIRYFIHMLKNSGYFDVYVVSIGSETPACQRYNIMVFEGHTLVPADLGIKNRNLTEEQLQRLNREMNVQEWYHCASSEAEMISILKNSPAKFGVWGEEQMNCFSQFLDNVQDVSSDIMQELLNSQTNDEFHPKENALNRYYPSIADLFIAILRKHAGKLSIQPTGTLDEFFKEWVETLAWKSLLGCEVDDGVYESHMRYTYERLAEVM